MFDHFEVNKATHPSSTVQYSTVQSSRVLTIIQTLIVLMSISHYYNPQFNARAARAADSDAKTDKDQMVDSNAIDSLDHSLDQMSFEQCDGGIEGHLCGSFQHRYDQFQPDPHTARFSGREEIPRLVMRSENPSGGRTYNPMIFPPDNYCTPARLPPPPHASEESWI